MGNQDSPESTIIQKQPVSDQLPKFRARDKFFGSKAERLNREEFDLTVEEIHQKISNQFEKMQATEQLVDKESFGDVDIVVLRKPEFKIEPNQEFFKNIFGDNLLDYHRNDDVYSLLLKLELGKNCQVDFIYSRDEKEFERKYMFYSKGHTSGIVGMMSKKLNFKYGIQGFRKRFKDSKNNWHDVPITDDLKEGLKILGFDISKYYKVHTIDDIVDFVSSSSLFDSDYFDYSKLPRRDRESIKRLASQEYIQQALAGKEKHSQIDDRDKYFKEMYPEQYQFYLGEIERINKEINQHKAIDGRLVMDVFNLQPGKQVGLVLKYIKENYADALEITPNMKEKINKLLN